MALPGWNTFFGGLGALFSKIPIQGREERWRNQIDKLEKEKTELLKGECNVKKTKRVSSIDDELIKLYRLCKNNTK